MGVFITPIIFIFLIHMGLYLLGSQTPAHPRQPKQKVLLLIFK